MRLARGVGEHVALQRVDERVGVAVTVRSTNGVGVVAERVVRYDDDVMRGVAAETGSPTAARRWVALPAVGQAESDRLVVLNPGRERASLTITLAGVGESARGGREVAVPGGARFVVPLPSVGDGPVAARVESDRPVVVERTAYSPSAGDVATTMATPQQ